MSGEKPGEGEGHEPPRSPWLFLGTALQMAATIALGVAGGWWLDQRWSWAPWGILGGGTIGMAAGIYYILRSLR
jgi:F0F1-type ATP synthase assembly protein I